MKRQDEDRIVAIRHGDERAFETLFREHYGPLAAFARHYVADDAAAEELVQELFADLWAARGRWEIRTSLRAYLFTAVRNRALSARRRSLTERDWDDAGARAETDAMQWMPLAPDSIIEQHEMSAALARAFAALPERCRLVMELRWRDEMSYAEIAETMGISIKGVENQLARGLAALRSRLAHWR